MSTRRLVLAVVLATGGLLVMSAPAALADDARADGRVTVNGKPFAGKISFHWEDQFLGSKSNQEGKYKIRRVMSGKYKVTIEGKGIPAKYTSEDTSGLTVEVKAGSNTFDFDIRT